MLLTQQPWVQISTLTKFPCQIFEAKRCKNRGVGKKSERRPIEPQKFPSSYWVPQPSRLSISKNLFRVDIFFHHFWSLPKKNVWACFVFFFFWARRPPSIHSLCKSNQSFGEILSSITNFYLFLWHDLDFFFPQASAVLFLWYDHYWSNSILAQKGTN